MRENNYFPFFIALVSLLALVIAVSPDEVRAKAPLEQLEQIAS